VAEAEAVSVVVNEAAAGAEAVAASVVVNEAAAEAATAPVGVKEAVAAEAAAPAVLLPEPTLQLLPPEIPMPSGVTVDSVLVRYVKNRERLRATVHGIAGPTEGTIYKSAGLNEFEPEATVVGDEFVRKSLAGEDWYVKNHLWNPCRLPLVPAKVPEYDAAEWYATHFNGLRPFVVYLLPAGGGGGGGAAAVGEVAACEVVVYQIPDDKYVPKALAATTNNHNTSSSSSSSSSSNNNNNNSQAAAVVEHRLLYTQRLARYHADRVFVPMDVTNAAGSEMFAGDDARRTNNSHGSRNGSAILAVIGDDTGVFVGKFFFTFPLAGDRIVAFYSEVGRNDVPYPVAVGREFVYFLTELAQVPRAELDPFCKSPADWASAYQHYYNHSKLCPGLTKRAIAYKVPHPSQFMPLLVQKPRF
jgi:hypothetical protein